MILAADAIDNVRVANVIFWRWDGPTSKWIQLASLNSAPYQTTIDCTSVNMGQNGMYVQAYDSTGNVQGEWLGLVRDVPDTQAPTVNWTAPVGNDQTAHCTSGTVTLAADASDNVAVANVIFWRWDGPTSKWIELASVSSAPYQTTIDCTSVNLGQNGMYAQAYDKAGNVQGQWHGLVRDLPDTQAPVVHWTVPTSDNQTAHCTGGTVTLSANASDNVAVADVYFWRWDSQTAKWVYLADTHTAPYRYSLTCTSLNMGWNYLYVQAYDAAGNVSGQGFYLVRNQPDTQAPVVHWVTPVSNNHIARCTTGMMALTAYASDNVGVTKVYFWRWNSRTYKRVYIANIHTAPYRTRVTCSTLNTGWNYFFVQAFDAAGHVSTARITIIH